MLHTYNNPDFLHPIGDRNRDETIVIPFTRGLKNLNFAILKGILGDAVHDMGIRAKFPRLRNLLNMTSFQMYDETALFLRPIDCVYAMADQKLRWDECERIAEYYLRDINYWKLHTTRLEFVCYKLLKQPFMKHLYILTDKMSNEIGAYCSQQFRDHVAEKRVSVIEGDLTGFLLEHPEVTTVFTRSVSEIFALEENAPQTMAQKYFVSIVCYDDIERAPNGLIVYKQYDRLLKYMEDEVCSVVHMYPYATLLPEL